MKNRKVYLIIAYMLIVLAITLLVVNKDVFAIESNTEGNSAVNTNVSIDKTIFKAKVKYKKFPLFDENNPVIRKEVLVGLTKNGVDLGKKYEKFVSTRFDEVELTWDNLEKYTVENGEKKENEYKIILKTELKRGSDGYDFDLKDNEIIITANLYFTDYHASVTYEFFDPNDIKPEITVELLAYVKNEDNPGSHIVNKGEKYEKTITPKGKNNFELVWTGLPKPGVREYWIRIKNEEALDKEKYKVEYNLGNITIYKNKSIDKVGEEVIIKDLVFKKKLIDIINQNNRNKPNYHIATYKEKTVDSKIYKEELAEIKNLGIMNDDLIHWKTDFDFKEIKTLEGIEYLTNLEEINISGADKKQILEISKLKTIKKLQISDTDDFDPKYLNGFINLENLKILLDKNSSLKDLSFLKYMKNLNKLEIIGKESEIKNLDDIKDSSIKELYIEVKTIPNIKPIGENSNLEKLTIKLPGIGSVLHGGNDKERYNAKLDAYIQYVTYYHYNKGLSREEILKYIKDNFEEENERFINEYIKESNNITYIKDIKELSKLKNLKELILTGVGLENIDGISDLKNLEELNLSNNFISNLSEILKLDKLKRLDISKMPIYDKRLIKDLDKKINWVNHGDLYNHGNEFKFVINPEKFVLPEIYNEKGEKFNLLDKENFIEAPFASGDTYFNILVDLYKDINNIIKKNEDGTYSYKYKPYEPITIVKTGNINVRVELYPILSDYNDQNLRKNDSRYTIDKTKIVKFKNEKIKKYILAELQNYGKFNNRNETVGMNGYVKDLKETEIYEDELKFIHRVDLSEYSYSLVKFEEGEDISDLAMFTNLNELIIHREVKSLEFLKDLPNLRKLKLYALKKGQHLPKFKEDNKINSLEISIHKEKEKFDKEQFEMIKKDIMDNNLSNLKYLTVSYFSKISLIGLEDLKNLNSYADYTIYGRIDSKNYMVDTYEGEELNVNYNNKKIITEKELVPFDKNTDENVVIRTVFKPTTKKFRINILDKVNNKNIEINDPALKRNEDGTYEIISYEKKIQEVIFEIDGKKVILKIDTTGMPLTKEEELERKEEKQEKAFYNKQDLKKIAEEANYILDPDEDMTPEEIEEKKKNNELEFKKVKNVSFVVENNNDLELLGKFKNIENLNLNMNISDGSNLDWSIIKNLKNLKKLFIPNGFDIVNIEGIESLEELITSEVKDYYDNDGERRLNELSMNFKNIEKVSTLKNLKVLNLTSSNIKSIDFLKELINLEELYLGDNKIENLDALKNLNKLRIVKLTANEIVNIDGLKNKENLRVVELQENKIKDISVLEKSVELYRLDIIKNDVENVNVLRNFKKLNYIGLAENPRLKGLSGLKEALKENISPEIFMNVTDTSVEDEDLVETINANDRIGAAFSRGNTINIKPKRNRFNINLTQNGNKIELSDAPFFRNSGLIKNEDGTYSFKDYKNSGVIRLNVGYLPRWIEKEDYITYEGELRPYHYLYIDPSEIEEDEVKFEKGEPEIHEKPEIEIPKEENKVEEKEEVKPNRRLPYAGMQDDSMLKVALVLVGMYTIASFNLYKKGLEKKNNNK